MKDDFYNKLEPFYHLVFDNWEYSINNQAKQIKQIFKKYTDNHIKNILDVSCGIGTQSIGLASNGYKITASDFSENEINRAKKEAEKRNLDISFSVADMRYAYKHHKKEFDVVLSFDNSIPHLLNDEDILTAFKQFYLCTKHGGYCLISVRDYEKEDLTKTQIKTYGLREDKSKKYFLFQTWEFKKNICDISMYIIEDTGSKTCKTYVMRSKYYTVTIEVLINIIKKAGFTNIQRIDNMFYQPVIIGRKV
ncbi:MAG TPA: class I SAM-dependent methyltransferase [Victivallales bacterium]|nr:class I SAM-dependent methyltransferase [Victivallales bacterium]